MFASFFGGLDGSVWQFFRDHELLIGVAKMYTQWGVSSVLTPLALIFGVGLVMKNRPISQAVTPIVSLQVCGILTAYVKSWTAVSRPPKNDWLAGASGGSFPSGHVSNTTAFVIAIALVMMAEVVSRRASIWVWVSASVMIALMGWTRLALRVHWLSDVVGGWLVGAAVAFGCHWLLSKFRRASPLRTLDHRAS